MSAVLLDDMDALLLLTIFPQQVVVLLEGQPESLDDFHMVDFDGAVLAVFLDARGEAPILSPSCESLRPTCEYMPADSWNTSSSHGMAFTCL